VGVEQGVSVFELVGLWQALQDLLDCEVNLITEGISDQRFMRRIQRDVVPL
jgi:predicted nucleotidyltransferase